MVTFSRSKRAGVATPFTDALIEYWPVELLAVTVRRDCPLALVTAVPVAGVVLAPVPGEV